MGGSSSYIGGGGGSTSDGFNCGNIFEFLVIIQGNEETVWKECKVGQDVHIEFNKANLPRLEVKRSLDDLVIGLVPATYAILINCIERGWKYEGTINRITGNEYDPKIQVKVNGVK